MGGRGFRGITGEADRGGFGPVVASDCTFSPTLPTGLAAITDPDGFVINVMQDFTGSLLVASSTNRIPVYAGGVCLVVSDDDQQTIGVMLNRPLNLGHDAIAALYRNLTQSGPTAGIEGSTEADWQSDVSSDWSTDDEDPDLDMPDAELPEAEMVDDWQVDDDDEVVEAIIESPTSGRGLTPNAPTTSPLHFGGPVSGPVVALHQTHALAEMEPGRGIYVAAHREALQQLVAAGDPDTRLIVGHLRWTPGGVSQEIVHGLWHPLPATAEDVFADSRLMWPRLVRRGTTQSLARWIGVDNMPPDPRLN